MDSLLEEEQELLEKARNINSQINEDEDDEETSEAGYMAMSNVFARLTEIQRLKEVEENSSRFVQVPVETTDNLYAGTQRWSDLYEGTYGLQ